MYAIVESLPNEKTFRNSNTEFWLIRLIQGRAKNSTQLSQRVFDGLVANKIFKYLHIHSLI